MDTVIILANPGYINNYIVHPYDNLGYFAPDSGSYILGYWFRQDDPGVALHLSPSITVKVNDNVINIVPVLVQALSMLKAGIVQNTNLIFHQKSNSIKVIINNTGNSYVYLDDVRIHPFNANMKTFVYDRLPLNY